MKPITKQLVIAVFILISVTVLSFGIRQVRLGTYRADTGESTPSARPSDTEGQHQLDKSLNADAEPEYYSDDSYTIDDEHDSQYADASDWDEQSPSEENADSIKYDKSLSKTKSFKGGFATSEGKKGLQKISLGDNENIYITKEGEAWYVSEQPDGSASKMQVQIGDITGEITFVGGDYYGKSGGSQDLQGISMGDYESIYIPGEGELWFKADGSLLEADIIGEVTTVTVEEINEYSDNGEEHATKD